MFRAPHRFALTILVVLASGLALSAVERRAAHADAFVDVDHSTGEWTIGNDAILYTVRISSSGAMRAVMLAAAGGPGPITQPMASDTVLTFDDEAVRPGEAGTGFVVTGIEPSNGGHFVSLAVRLESRSRGLAAIRHYVVYPGVAVVELWTSLETLDDEPRRVRNLNAFDLAFGRGRVDYVTGLAVSPDNPLPFTRRSRTLDHGESFELGSPTLSSESTMPYLSIGNGESRIIAGLAWSGAWSARLARDDDVLSLSMGLPRMSATASPGAPVEGPHAFIGVVSDTPGADVTAVTRYVRESRAGRPFPAWTTFNTWFVRGINIDEETARRDMDYAAAIGVELFQLDAGWYPRTSPDHAFDFTDGLGTWEADRDRFPSGLARLRQDAHARGLKFGLWVEPERVSLDTVGRPGLAVEAFLARQDGAYHPGGPNDTARDAQICLANPAARAWVHAKLFALLDEVRPDNLKWDFNRWLHCTRTDHGHAADGGNYAHTRALYDLLTALRARYPEMTIENCATGAHRLDFAIARLTDAAWMDDRTAPSGHVRRNLNGLLQLLPAHYLFSYVMPHADDPLHGAPDLPLVVRSRMPGIVGVAAALDQLDERETNVLHQELELAKRLRAMQGGAVTHVLTPQRDGPGEWEVVQQVDPHTGASVIYTFSQGASRSTRVMLRGIDAATRYELRSADRGVIGQVAGADLLAGGLEIVEAPESAAQVLVLTPLAASAKR